MKWTTWFILLAWMTSGLLTDISGGSQSLVIPNNPFFSLGYSGCNLQVTLTSPTESETYYSPQIDINYSWSGGTPTSCYYKIDGYLWNQIPCNGSITRTLGVGEQTLTIHIEERSCTSEDSVSFTILGRADYWGYLSYTFLAAIFIGCVLMLGIMML